MLARMSKKALSLLMVFCMVVSTLSISALAIDLPSGENEDDRFFGHRPTDETGIQSVYVYVEAKEGQGTLNGHGYFTIGEIKMELPAPGTVTAGENYYDQYQSGISLDGIVRFEDNEWLDLNDVEWNKLLVADGADDYVDSGTPAWHLDGKIVERVQLYYVT